MKGARPLPWLCWLPMRLFALVALLLAGCAGPRAAGHAAPIEAEGLEPGSLLTPAGEPLSLATFASATESARYILVGEAHDNACDHRVQAAVVATLAERLPVVGLEMVSTERQPILDRFAAGEIAMGELEEALDWQERWGVPFEIYRPIFEAAALSSLPVAALNLPREAVRQVSREGASALPPEVPALIPPPKEQVPMLRRAFEAHGHGTEEDFARFVRIQSLWDTAMARNSIAFGERFGAPVVILAGNGHVQHGWGIGHRLRLLQPEAEVVEVVPWRGREPIDPGAGRFFFYCPPPEAE